MIFLLKKCGLCCFRGYFQMVAVVLEIITVPRCDQYCNCKKYYMISTEQFW